MSTRRLALLEPVTHEINPAAYLLLMKEMTFEMGGISQDMLELKSLRIDQKV